MKATFAALLWMGVSIASAQPYTLDSFDTELQRIEASLERDRTGVGAGLPPSWEIRTPTHAYSVSSGPLQSLLQAPDATPSREWIRRLREHLRASAMPLAKNDAGDQAAMREILSRKEFKDVEPPGEWQLFVNRIEQAITGWFQGLGAFIEQHPTGSAVLFWTLIGGGVIALGAWLYRLWKENDYVPSIPAPLAFEQPLRPWQEWLQEARRAAEKGEHRQAIRFGYWAGIARLQLDRTVPLSFSITPRERLHLLSRSQTGTKPIPASQIEPLQGITASLERFWYADLPANGEDVALVFRNLESLQCKGD